jgi:hypothetical protein
MCVMSFSTNSLEIFQVLRRIQGDLIKKFIGLHTKCPLFLSNLNETGIFSTDFQKNTQVLHFIKICRADTELVHADRQKERPEKANSNFSPVCVGASEPII